MKRDIRIKWFLPHPPENVWFFLTDKKMISQWLMENNFEPIVGHRFNFHTKPLPKMNFDGIVYCEVLEVVPAKKLVYTWRGGPAPGVVTLDTVVTWTLQAKNNGTELLLEQTGFNGFGNYVASIFMGTGWKKKILRRLESLLTDFSATQV